MDKKIEISVIEDAYSLLKDVIQDAYHADCILLDGFDTDSASKVDRGIRAMMWEGFGENPVVPESLADVEGRLMAFVIKSNLGFDNVIYLIPGYSDEEKAAEIGAVSLDESISRMNSNKHGGDVSSHTKIISIGPFRNEDISQEYFDRIVRDAGVPASAMANAAQVFRNLPIADTSTLVNISKRILSAYIPALAEIEVRELSFHDEEHKVSIDEFMADARMADYAQEGQDLLLDYLKALSQGDGTRCKKIMNSYLNFLRLDQDKSILQIKEYLNTLNTVSSACMITTNVHPKYTLDLSYKMRDLINSTNDQVKLCSIPYEISRKYCLLVKNYDHSDYSLCVRQILNYVPFHLEEDLSLSMLAELVGRNPSSLSAQFHQEYGETITTYIKKERIAKAVSIMNTGDDSVADIAVSVGYFDFAYFSRVFKEITGLSPRDYKKMKK